MAAEGEGRIKAVEGELGLLKNQIQQTLLDIREHVLELTNPFGAAGRPARDWGSRPAPAAAPQPAQMVTTVMAPSAPPMPMEQIVETFETPPPPEPEPEPQPEPEPVAEATHGFESFDALFDAPAAPGLENPGVAAPQNMWDEPPAPAAAPEPRRGASFPRDHHEPPAPQSAPETPMDKGSKIDLITLTSMVKWVDQTTRRIGKERVMVILDIYEMAGRINPTTKQLVQRLCALADGSSEQSIPLRDVVGAMLQIDGLLDAKQPDERRLLGLLVDDSFDPFQGLIPSRNGNH